MAPAVLADSLLVTRIVFSVLFFALSFACVCAAYRPVSDYIRRQEWLFDHVLRRRLLIDVAPRTATILSGIGVVLLALLAWSISGSTFGGLLGAAAGVVLPSMTLRFLARRRVAKLESQIVSGVQTLASGVRAGLNLVQSMQLVARDAPTPLCQEFRHLLREYEYGISLEEAMSNAADRIGSNDFRLLFAALLTHRERGGDLGETLDRIAASIREIQRLEARVAALTAQGRATARLLGVMPAVVMGILYLLVEPEGVRNLFVDPLGKVFIFAIVVLNLVGFLWIRRIMNVDI